MKEIVDYDQLDRLISQTQRNTALKSVKSIFWLSPNRWETLYEKLVDRHERKPFQDWEDIESWLINTPDLPQHPT